MYEERIDLRGMLRRMIGHPKKQATAYKQRDAIANIHADSPPILIVHGGKDKQVGIHQAYYLETQLKHIGSTFKHFIKWMKTVPRPFAMKQRYIQLNNG